MCIYLSQIGFAKEICATCCLFMDYHMRYVAMLCTSMLRDSQRENLFSDCPFICFHDGVSCWSGESRNASPAIYVWCATTHKKIHVSTKLPLSWSATHPANMTVELGWEFGRLDWSVRDHFSHFIVLQAIYEIFNPTRCSTKLVIWNSNNKEHKPMEIKYSLEKYEINLFFLFLWKFCIAIIKGKLPYECN